MNTTTSYINQRTTARIQLPIHPSTGAFDRGHHHGPRPFTAVTERKPADSRTHKASRSKLPRSVQDWRFAGSPDILETAVYRPDTGQPFFNIAKNFAEMGHDWKMNRVYKYTSHMLRDNQCDPGAINQILGSRGRTANSITLGGREIVWDALYPKHATRSAKRPIHHSVIVNTKIRKLGDSYALALGRFRSLERALARNPTQHEQHPAFMQEYETLGHMTKVRQAITTEGYRLPHHTVRKKDSLTTKLQIVFDASAKTRRDFHLTTP